MAKKKAKKKAKVKAKAKAKPKVKAKAKAKPKPKAKAKPKPKAKPRAKAKEKQHGPPPTVTPGMCDDFTAQTGAGVAWLSVPTGGCWVYQIPGTTWPFTPPSPIFVPSPNPGLTPNAIVNVGQGKYQIDVKCCQNQVPKNVTVP